MTDVSAFDFFVVRYDDRLVGEDAGTVEAVLSIVALSRGRLCVFPARDFTTLAAMTTYKCVR